MRLKKRRKGNILNIITLFIIIIIICLVYIFKLFNDKALPQLLSYSEIETKKIVTSVIDSTVINETYKNSSVDKLFITTKDSDNNIVNIDFDPKYVNKILVDTYEAVLKNMKYLESGNTDKLNLSNISYNKEGIIYEIPSGVIFNNVILNNIFPKIPVKMDLIGNIFCRLDSDIKSYGINNALITISIEVEVEVKILLPFVSKNTKIKEKIPILIKIIEGNIPSYYFGGNLSSPYISKSIN